MNYLWIYLAVMNLLALLLCLADKRAAVRHKWRIPEARLFLVAFLGGALGLWGGMLLFRHKTKHLKFMLGVPTLFFLQVAGIIGFFYLFYWR